MGHIAGRVTTQTAMAAADAVVNVEGSQPIIVYGYTISNESSTQAIVTFSTAIDRSSQPGGNAAGTVFNTIVVDADNLPTDEGQVAFMADSGLRLDVTAGTANITIYHSQQGS